MNLWMTIRIARLALAKNKMRAGLTVLGIVIGIAAVITMVSLGQGAGAMVQNEFQSLGTNVIMVFPGRMQGGGVRQSNVKTLTGADATAIFEQCNAVLAATPVVSMQAQAIYGNVNWAPREILGVDDSYPLVRNWQVMSGSFFTANEVKSAAQLCVIGKTIAKKLFQTTNPVGQMIRIKGVPFTVIGVLEEKGASMVGQDQDDLIVAPYTTVKQRLSGSEFFNVDMIVASARSTERMPEAQTEIEYLLRDRHKIRTGEADDFTVRNTSEIAGVLGVITGVMTMLLASIASVSLLVGGVGIMNIMLVSVTERTREIGIRMAVGARGSDILRQFLIEAVLLSAIGGAVGVLLGVAASMGITAGINAVTKGTKWPLVISVEAIFAAMLVASSVGIFFGYYPARKASRLDPIDSLRYE
ncbi:MAG: ABC transporter permease [Planctomycetota bacterium]|nr:ABC transporter permease [Planctomycetota bacterium]